MPPTTDVSQRGRCWTQTHAANMVIGMHRAREMLFARKKPGPTGGIFPSRSTERSTPSTLHPMNWSTVLTTRKEKAASRIASRPFHQR